MTGNGGGAGGAAGALDLGEGHDPAAERAVVRDELMKIVRLRLAKAFE